MKQQNILTSQHRNTNCNTETPKHRNTDFNTETPQSASWRTTLKHRNTATLNYYASAAATFLFVHEKAQAHIVYTDLDPDITIAANDTAYIDIDGDSINDIVFWIESKRDTIITSAGASVPYTYRFAMADALNLNVLIGKGNTADGYSFNSAYRVSSGEEINDSLPQFAGEALLAAAIFTNDELIYSGGPWNGIENSIMGIRFRINDLNYFGWMRLSVDSGGTSVTIHETAYDNFAGWPIAAGLTTQVDYNPTDENPIIYSENSILHILIPNLEQQLTCSIYNLNGQLINQQIIYNEHTWIELSGEVNMYIIKLSGDDYEFTQKIIL